MGGGYNEKNEGLLERWETKQNDRSSMLVSPYHLNQDKTSVAFTPLGVIRDSQQV